MIHAAGGEMVTAWVMPVPKTYFEDNNGLPLAGGFVYTYTAGTLTPQATYADADQNANNTNPVVLDSSGRAVIFWGPNPYDVIVTDSQGTQLYTVSSFTVPGTSGSSGSGGGFGMDTEIASSTTVDLGTITSHLATVTGTVTTTSFGTSASVTAPIYLMKAQSANWTITLSAAILCPYFPSGTIVSKQNDYYWMEYLGSGVWKIFGICRGDGSADFTDIRCVNLTETG